MANIKWELGTFFSTKDDFKEEITTYDVQSGRKLKFTKKDNKKVMVGCKENCDWEVYCGKLPKKES